MSSNRPNTQELIESVREMLETQLSPTLTDKGMAYSTRVAVNILKIVEREIQRSDEFVLNTFASLSSIVGAESDGLESIESMNLLLVEKINQGEFDADNSALLAHLQSTILDKIAIDNPQYETYKRYLDSGELHSY